MHRFAARAKQRHTVLALRDQDRLKAVLFQQAGAGGVNVEITVVVEIAGFGCLAPIGCQQRGPAILAVILSLWIYEHRLFSPLCFVEDSYQKVVC